MTRPDVIRRIHEAYLRSRRGYHRNEYVRRDVASCWRNMISPTGRGNSIWRRRGLAVEAANKYSTADWPRYVAGAIGPTTKTLSVTGGVTFDELVECYYEQALALIEGGVDLHAARNVPGYAECEGGQHRRPPSVRRAGKTLPIMISGTIEPMGTTLAGQNIESFYISLEHLKPISVGLNCATGPEFMRDHIRTLSGIAEDSDQLLSECRIAGRERPLP